MSELLSYSWRMGLCLFDSTGVWARGAVRFSIRPWNYKKWSCFETNINFSLFLFLYLHRMLSQLVTVKDRPYLVLSTGEKSWLVGVWSCAALSESNYVPQWCPQDWPWVQSRTELICLIFPPSAFSSYPCLDCAHVYLMSLGSLRGSTPPPSLLIALSRSALRSSAW